MIHKFWVGWLSKTLSDNYEPTHDELAYYRWVSVDTAQAAREVATGAIPDAYHAAPKVDLVHYDQYGAALGSEADVDLTDPKWDT